MTAAGTTTVGDDGWLIDVHGHLAAEGAARFGPPSLYDPEGAIAAKRELGVGMTVIGSPVGPGAMLPELAADNYRQPVDRVREYNESIGRLVDRFPDSLRAYAYLDPFGDDAMLDQATELVAEPQFVGMIVNTSIDGELLGSPRADRFFAMVAQADVPVLLHPAARPVGTECFDRLGLVEHVARPCDVTLGVASVICGGWLERYPALRLIAAAGGGALALLGEKLDLAMAAGAGPFAMPSPLSASPSASLARILVDTSNPSPVQLQANIEAFGAENVLLGTDAPPLMDVVRPIMEMIDDRADGTARGLIGRGNALHVFGPALTGASGAHR